MIPFFPFNLYICLIGIVYLYEKDKVDLSLHNAKALLMAFSLSVVVKWDELL